MQDFSKAEVSRNHNNSFKASIKSALDFIDKLSSEYQTNREELEVLRKERAAIIENLIQILKTNKIKIDKPLGKCNNSELNEELLKVINDMDFIERENFQCDLIKINNRYAKIMELGKKLDILSNELGTIHIPEADYDDELIIDFGTPIQPYKIEKYDVSEEVISSNDIIVDSSIYIEEEPISLEEEIIRDINPNNIINDHIEEEPMEDITTQIEIVPEEIIEENNDFIEEIEENNSNEEDNVEIENQDYLISDETNNYIQEISIEEPNENVEDNSNDSIPFIIEEKSLIENIIDDEIKIEEEPINNETESVQEEPKEQPIKNELLDDNELINQYLDSIQPIEEVVEPKVEEVIEPKVEEDNEDFLFYEITNNVTLEEIAESVYEDSKLWKELYNYDINKDIIDKLAKTKKKSIKDICTTPGDLNNVKLKFPVELITYEEIINEK